MASLYLSPRPAQRGFSMIEVLVTMLIISLALLGTAGLQGYSMRLNQGGQFRSQAVFLVADLAERMEANKPGVAAGTYNLPLANAANALSTACLDAACVQGNLAAFDLSQWQNAVAASLPQSSWRVVNAAGNPAVVTITINWVDRRTNTQYGTAGTGETFSYTATRTIFN